MSKQAFIEWCLVVILAGLVGGVAWLTYGATILRWVGVGR